MLIAAKVITEFTHSSFHIRFGFIALISALPILLFSSKRWSVMKGLDWGTLLFFISTFILIQSVWDSGFFQNYIQHSHISITHTPTIMAISVFLSQFISNVPLVTLYLPLLNHALASQAHLLALAVGSTIAGNLTILGAASNIIIAHSAEMRKSEGFSFYDFIKLGIPLTTVNVVIYAFFL
jgi:Na+/H+ antiporter NhaD/arsenite permease-like protein